MATKLAGFVASARTCHTGGAPAKISTEGTDLAIVVTELYVAEVFGKAGMVVNGVAPMFGSATEGTANGTGTKVMLFNSAGKRLAISADTDVSGFTVDEYGRIAFTAPITLPADGSYYIGVISGVNTNKLNTHILGSFGAGKLTGLVYATEAGYATIVPPTTFTTGLGPIASLY